MNLDAKGEGENSVKNMLKRISRETSDLYGQFTALEVKYEDTLTENQTLNRKLKDRQKLVNFLEKEIARRNEEFKNMACFYFL